MGPPVQHAGDLAYTEQEAPFHHPVQQGSGEEMLMSGGGGYMGEYGEGLPGIWKTTRNCQLV